MFLYQPDIGTYGMKVKVTLPRVTGHLSTKCFNLWQPAIYAKKKAKIQSMKHCREKVSWVCFIGFIFYVLFCDVCFPWPEQWWYLPELLFPSMFGANGAGSSDALTVIGVFVSISVLLWFTLSACVPRHPPPPTSPPPSSSVVRPERLSVDEAKRAASAAQLGWASALCRACR